MLVVEPLRFALEIRPEFIAFEQVAPVLPLWECVAEYLEDAGYHTWTGKLYAEEYGVPQTRRRAILLASLDGPVAPPAPTHHRYNPRAPRPEAGDGLKPWVSMAEALGWTDTDLVGFPRRADRGETVTLGGVEYRARDLRAASNPAFGMTEKARSWGRFPTHYDQRQTGAVPRSVDAPAPTMLAMGLAKGVPVWRGGYFRGDAQANATVRPIDAPAPTIKGGHSSLDMGWVRQSGIRLSIEEASILQSFRADYPWQGSRSSAFLQVGNAVPPLMARRIVEALVGPALSLTEEAA
jgi:DNA (cytosine-5)-methyltransferase 1